MEEDVRINQAFVIQSKHDYSAAYLEISYSLKAFSVDTIKTNVVLIIMTAVVSKPSTVHAL